MKPTTSRTLLESLERRVLLAGTGLTAQYYDNADLTTLKKTQVDAKVDFSWGTSAPVGGVGADTFSVRWAGQVEAQYSEQYTFYLTADDGARLWVNNRLLIGDWTDHVAREATGRIALRAGQRYDIRVEYYDNLANATVKLEWASATQTRQVVPTAQLYPTSSPDDRGSIQSEMWTGIAGNTIASLTADANYPAKPSSREYLTSFQSLQSNWADNYGQRIRGYLYPAVTGSYVLAVSGDDVAELYLSTDSTVANKKLIASATGTAYGDFSAQPSQRSTAMTLTAGQKYYIEALVKESTESDHVEVGWQVPGSAQVQIIDGAYLSPYGTDSTTPAQGSFLATLARGRPRLLSTPQRFEWARQQIAAGGQVKTWYDSIKTNATNLLDDPLPAYVVDVRGTILDVSRSVMDHIYKLALVYRISGETQYADRAWAELNAAANFPDWHPAHFLDTAEMTHAFAIGYDWLYDYWTPAQRTTLSNAIMNMGLNQALPLYRNGTSWTTSTSNNWNLVCNGGMILGALAIAEDQPTLVEEILAKAIPSVRAVMNHFTADAGAWYEGPGYWAYSTDYSVPMMSALEDALGSDFKLAQTSMMSETANFAVSNTGPTDLSFNFADGGAGKMIGPKLFWYARRYNRPELSNWYRNYNSSSVMGVLWYDPRGGEPAANLLPTDAQWRGDTTSYATQDVVNLRTRWNDPDASFVGFKGGKIGESHGDLDAGSFVFDALGTRWAQDLGADDYALPGYFGSTRNDYYRIRAEGHNTLVINPSSGTDQVVGAKANVARFESSADRAYAVADLTPVYTGATKIQRGTLLDKSDGSLLVQDEIQMSAKAELYWFMHYRSDTTSVELSADGTSAMLTTGADRLWIKIVAGGGARLEIMDAVPLATSPNPAGQNANATYKKLAIHLLNVTSRTLAVWLVPLKPGQSPPVVMPTISAISNWSVGSEKRYWLGDVDGYVPGGAATPDATWSSTVSAASGLTPITQDDPTDNRIVPLTFTYSVPAGQMVSWARLDVGLKSTGGNTADDVLYLDSTSSPIPFTVLGWTKLTTTPAARSFDLTNQLNLLQDGKLNIAISNNSAMDWASLTIRLAPTGQYTPATLYSEADAYVRDGSYATTNFNTTELVTKLDTANSGYNRESFIRFNVSSLTSPVMAAYLRLNPTNAASPAENQLSFVSDDSWSETGVTWNTRPSAASPLVSWTTVAAMPVLLDVTDLVNTAISGDKKVSVKLTSTTLGASYYAGYGTREAANADLRPQLLVTNYAAAAGNTLAISGDQQQPNQDDTIRLVREGGYLNVFVNNATTPVLRRDFATVDQITVNALGGNDSVTLDSSAGSFFPAGGLSVDGGAGIDTLRLVQGSADDTVEVTPTATLLNGSSIPLANLENSSFDMGAGADLLRINGGSVTLAPDGLISSGADVTLDAGGALDLGGTTQTLDVFTLNDGNVSNGAFAAKTITLYSGNVSAAIGGTSGLIKKGTGTVILSGPSTYTGVTRLEQGILNVRSASSLGASTDLVQFAVDGSVSRFASLELDGLDFSMSKPMQISGPGQAAGALRNVSGNHTWAGDITLVGGGGGSAFQSDAGLLTIAGNITTNITSRSITLTGAGDGRISGNISDGLTVGLPITKTGAGTWTLAGNDSYTGLTAVSAGALVFDSTHKLGAQLKVSAGAIARLSPGGNKVLVVPSLSVDSAKGAKLDLGNGAMIIDYAPGSSPLAATQSLIKSGYNNGAWDGAGVNTSASLGATKTALGFGEASSILGLSGTNTANWMGQVVDASSILVRYTLSGDANLDGKVDFADMVKVSQNYKSTTGTWAIGDFNFDGKVDFSDLVRVSQNYKQNVATLLA